MEKHFHSCQLRFLNFFHKDNVTNDDLIRPVGNVSKTKRSKAGGSLYNRFRPPFQRLCEMAEESGKRGIVVVNEEIECYQVALTALSAPKFHAQKDCRIRRLSVQVRKS